ncbi:hypothetical protein VSR34_35975 [Paraburkholderia sp. JHI2823]|uniref:hypothetical protein n=1 Tax=Paraburkholderia sp. JHI2823 TaxID=3112960 RepID=UPI00317A9BD8
MTEDIKMTVRKSKSGMRIQRGGVGFIYHIPARRSDARSRNYMRILWVMIGLFGRREAGREKYRQMPSRKGAQRTHKRRPGTVHFDSALRGALILDYEAPKSPVVDLVATSIR